MTPSASAGPLDTGLILERRRRLDASGRWLDFLAAEIAGEMTDRLQSVLRKFPRMAVIGEYPDTLKRYLADRDGTDVVRHIGVNDIERHDGEPVLGLKAGGFDCVIAVMGLDSLNDIVGGLIQFRHALKPDGLLMASLLGAGSLNELRQSWLEAETLMTGGASPRVAPFTDIRDAGALLQRAGFALPVADKSRITVRYDNALKAMREVKCLGLSNPLAARSRVPVNRPLLAASAAAYERNFADPDGRVRLSFEVVYLTGWVPHESQQKPLQPGSAKTRLAEALGTVETALKDSE